MLIQTGLGDVLEAAVMPSLLFLPSLTPVKDSLVLLKEAYDALFVLGDLRFPHKDDRPKRNKFFDRVMREGILYGFANCQETASIMELLFGEMGKIINRLNIYSVKHLKASIVTNSVNAIANIWPGHYTLGFCSPDGSICTF